MKETWDTKIEQRPLRVFSSKLKLLKTKLSAGNGDVFGNIQQNIKIVEDEVVQMEIDFNSVPSKANKVKLCWAQQKL